MKFLKEELALIDEDKIPQIKGPNGEKSKGDTTNSLGCGSYRGINFVGHSMKLHERWHDDMYFWVYCELKYRPV